MVDQETLDKVFAGQLEPQNLDLSGANLCGLDLRRRNFFAADLSGADLSGADLRWANLMYADLRGAKLDGADLFSARFDHARLDDLVGVNRCASGVTGPYKTPDVDSRSTDDAEVSRAIKVLLDSGVEGIDPNGVRVHRLEDGYLILWKKVEDETGEVHSDDFWWMTGKRPKWETFASEMIGSIRTRTDLGD